MTIKTRSKTKPPAKRKSVAQPSRLRISRCTASELMGGWSDREFDRLERNGLLTPVIRRNTIFYFIDDFRAVLQPTSKLAKDLANLKRVAPSGEIGTLTKEGASVFVDGWPLKVAQFNRVG